MTGEEKRSLATRRATQKANAERYLALRDALHDDECPFYVGVDAEAFKGRWGLSGEEADAAIDEWMASREVRS